MAHVSRFSFDMRGSALSIAMLALAGCVQQSSLLGDGLRLTTHDQAKDVVVVVTKPSSADLNLKTTLTDARASEILQPVITPAASKPEKLPAWCEYLREDTYAQTTIMRSPRMSGSIADDGKTSVSLGMSLTDFKKANLMEVTAEARCRRYMAESGLQKLVFLSPQGLTSAGYRAKHDSIQKSKKTLQDLRHKVAQAMNDGFLDREKATVLMGLTDQLLSEGASAKSQADRRTGDFLGRKDQASLLGREMLRAEADLEDLNSRMRTFDNVDVSVSAGWNEDITRDNFDVTSDAFSGKVSMSIKLGAILPQRYEHEQRAKQAKLRAIGEEGGAMWQVNVLRLAHERAIAGLEESRGKIDSALAEVNKLLATLEGVQNPEFQGTVYSAKIRSMQLKADKAAVDGSLAEIRTNLKRLKA
jgi:hypothetical protein